MLKYLLNKKISVYDKYVLYVCIQYVHVCCTFVLYAVHTCIYFNLNLFNSARESLMQAYLASYTSCVSNHSISGFHTWKQQIIVSMSNFQASNSLVWMKQLLPFKAAYIACLVLVWAISYGQMLQARPGQALAQPTVSLVG